MGENERKSEEKKSWKNREREPFSIYVRCVVEK